MKTFIHPDHTRILKGYSMGRPHVITACVILVFAFSAGIQAEESIPNAEAEARTAGSPDPSHITIEIVFEIAPEIHVYASEKKFAVDFTSLKGLGKPEVSLPEPEKMDLFGTETDVYTETKIIKALFPYTGNPGKKWSIQGRVRYSGCSDTKCYPPADAPFSASGTIPEDAVPLEEADTKEGTKPSEGGDDSPFSKGIILGILGSFMLGIGLSLTPCVYPMVGITVAIIASGESSKKRTVFLTFVYVLGLAIVYAAAGVIVAVAGSAASDFFQSPWLLIPIGILFVVLGLSMFDLLTIQTPSSWGGNVQKVGEKLKGSVPGIFLMGALSAFVVGPCVSAPVAGLIIKVAETGDIARGFAYFFALAWGMSVILFIAGSASGMLPKAGMWMQRIKHVIGIVLIWAAFYFTRPFIGETAFLTASIVLFALACTALKIFRIPEKGESVKALLKILAGTALFSVFTGYILMTHMPETGGIQYADLDRIVSESNKPILLDFTAWHCAICKQIDKSVLQLPEIQEELQKFTFVKLDYDTNKKIAHTFGILKGPPGFVFLDSEGNRIGDRVIVDGETLKNAILSFDWETYGIKKEKEEN